MEMDVGMTMVADQGDVRVDVDFPVAPPPSMFSVSGVSAFQPPEAGPSTYYHHHPMTYTSNQTQTTPPRRSGDPASVHPQSDSMHPSHVSYSHATSVSPNEGNVMAEPYWQDGLRGIVRPGGGVDGSPLGGQGWGERGGQGLMNEPEGTGSREMGGRKRVEEGMDLGRSVAMAMGMGVDSTMAHGDVEMVSE